MSRISATAAARLLLVSAACLLFSQSGMGEDKYPACTAANEKVDYGNGLTISEGTRGLIESYRSDWRKLCAPTGSRKPSLADLYVKAKLIEADFKRLFEAYDESLLTATTFDAHHADVVNDLVSKKYPAFVPAFKGAFLDHEYFSPSVEAFRKNDPLGNSQDRIFFESWIPLEGDFPPFITRTWDYGGCDQFGEYDWAGAFRNIARVQKQVKSPAYLKDTALFEDSIVKELSPGYDICTCKETAAVLKDLLEVQRTIRREAGFAKHVPKIQQTIDSIQSGKIKVKSDKENHCSGK